MRSRRFIRKIRIGVHSASDNRPKILKYTIIGIVAVTLVVVLTVLLGNHLKNKAESIGELPPIEDESTIGNKGNNDEKPDTLKEYSPADVPVVRAEYVTLSSAAGIDWNARAVSLRAQGTEAVSLVLYYGEGIVNYDSFIAQQMGYQSESNAKTSLDEATAALNASGIHSAGCFYATFHTKLEPSLVGVYRAYEAALISEALISDFSDVTVFGFGCDELGYYFAEQLFSEVKEYVPDAKLGVAIDSDVLELMECSMLFGNYAAVSDYLALDLSYCKTLDELTETVNSATALINKYNVRIMVSNELEGAEDALSALGIVNWQKIPD